MNQCSEFNNLFSLIPTFSTFAKFFTIGLISSWLSLLFCGALKWKKDVKTEYTRKINHFFVFSCVSLVNVAKGPSAVVSFALGVVFIVVFAVLIGEKSILYSAMAREKDAPFQKYYVVLPLVATAVGGVASNIFWGSKAAMLGYLISGIADAVAEPIGVCFGRIEYRVPSRAGGGTKRTLEGSIAVFLASFIIIILYCKMYLLIPSIGFSINPIMILFAVVIALVEAVSPHGFDNAFLQIVPSWIASTFLILE